MNYLSGKEESEAVEFIRMATEAALNSTCRRARCGCVIIKDGEVIGKGFNSPPFDKETQRRCFASKDSYHKKVTDKTCCVHAEQRAIMDALRKNPDKIAGSTLYFSRIDENGNPFAAEKPYCTICSKMTLDARIKEFVLLHDKGICVYDTEEYNDIFYGYNEE